MAVAVAGYGNIAVWGQPAALSAFISVHVFITVLILKRTTSFGVWMCFTSKVMSPLFKNSEAIPILKHQEAYRGREGKAWNILKVNS